MSSHFTEKELWQAIHRLCHYVEKNGNCSTRMRTFAAMIREKLNEDAASRSGQRLEPEQVEELRKLHYRRFAMVPGPLAEPLAKLELIEKHPGFPNCWTLTHAGKGFVEGLDR